VPIEVHFRTAALLCPHDNEPLRFGIGQWPKQDCVDQAEHSRVGANPDGNGRHGDSREHGRLAQHAHAVASVLQKKPRLQTPTLPLVLRASPFPSRPVPAAQNARPLSGVAPSRTFASATFSQVGIQFLGELALGLVSSDQLFQSGREMAKDVHDVPRARIPR